MNREVWKLPESEAERNAVSRCAPTNVWMSTWRERGWGRRWLVEEGMNRRTLREAQHEKHFKNRQAWEEALGRHRGLGSPSGFFRLFIPMQRWECFSGTLDQYYPTFFKPMTCLMSGNIFMDQGKVGIQLFKNLYKYLSIYSFKYIVYLHPL